MRYTAAHNIGAKFNADGTVRFFPGNTIISMIDHNDPIYEEFKGIRAQLKALKAADCMTFLPDDSLHMTVFEGVCHQWREPSAWTNLLPIDCKLSETDDLFEERFASVRPLGQVRMRAVELGGFGGQSLRLMPVSEADAAELKRYRDEMSEAFGIRFPNHDTYGFHISICYFVKEPTDADIKEIQAVHQKVKAYLAEKEVIFTPQPPVLTFFDNMFRFNPFRIPRNGL